MRKQSLLLVALLVSTAGLEALAQGAVFVEQPGHWGKVTRIVRPEYPPEALKNRATGVVDVEGVVEGSGRLSRVSYKPRGTASEAFVAALRAVVPFWQFTPAPGPDCQPDGGTVSTRVEFEIDAGQPRIFVTQLAQSRAAPTALKPVRMLRPNHPGMMQLRAVEARAYARADVDPAGNVVAVGAKAYPRRPPVAVNLAQAGAIAPATLPPQREAELGEFALAAEHALKRWTFPAAPGSSANRVFCAEFLFDLPK
jgi:TonB family protein